MSSGFFSIFIFPYEFWAFLFLSFRVGFVDFSLLNLLFPCGFVGFFLFLSPCEFRGFFFPVSSLLVSFGLFYFYLFVWVLWTFPYLTFSFLVVLWAFSIFISL